jgi:hypothetical protein
MKKDCSVRSVFSVCLICFIFCAFAQLAGPADLFGQTEEELVRQTALDYGDGFYAGDAVRLERALHPDLIKVAPLKLDPEGMTVLYASTVSGLIEAARAGLGNLAEDQRNIEVAALKIDQDLACVRLTSAQFNDYLLMLKSDGRWKIVNVLWTSGPAIPNRLAPDDFSPEKEGPRAERAVTEFMEGLLAGDALRLGKQLHPEFSLAEYRLHPNTGRAAIARKGAGLLLEIVRLNKRPVPPEQRHFECRLLDIMDGLAFVEVGSASSFIYFQLALLDGHWKIINALQKPLP